MTKSRTTKSNSKTPDKAPVNTPANAVAKAEENVEETENATLSLEEEVAMLKKQLAKANATIEQANETGTISPSVPGEIEVSWMTPIGNNIRRTIRFKNGRIYTYIDGILYPSAVVMRIANGKPATKKEVQKNPHLESLTQDRAVQHLLWLARIRSSTVEAVEEAIEKAQEES